MVAVKWVLIEFYNAADGVTESFRRDGAPVGATAANILITLDNCDARTLLNQGLPVLIHKSNRMVTFYRG